MSETNITILLASALLLAAAALAAAQNCGCRHGLCCSKYGYCGSGPDYCGIGCQMGPCNSSPHSGGGGSAGISVEEMVSQSFFDSISGQTDSNCEGKGFYTREAFLEAAESYTDFAQDASADDSKREMAAFFAHVAHESTHLCYTEETDESSSYCDTGIAQYPCAPGKRYHGRGPLQLSWNYNYGPAGEAIGFDGLGSPETVSEDPVISFKTALWYWMNDVHGVVGEGFGATIRAINGNLECQGRNPGEVNDRVSLYLLYCREFGVSPGDNLTC